LKALKLNNCRLRPSHQERERERKRDIIRNELSLGRKRRRRRRRRRRIEGALSACRSLVELRARCADGLEAKGACYRGKRDFM
jgi:hypothetical protein